MNALIIDDEPHIRDTLSKMLSRCCLQVQVVGEASGVAAGLSAIMELHPDLVFLDIHLCDGNAFDLLHALNIPDFGVVFISTFNRDMIQAFKLSGLEYLQKPFSPLDLAAVVKRSEYQDISHFGLQLKALEENLGYSWRQ